MHGRWIGLIVGVMALAGCSRSPPQSAVSGAEVSMSGCVVAAPGTDQYELRHIDIQEAPQALTSDSELIEYGLTEGSWVALQQGDRDLGPYVGEHVTVEGTVVSGGQNAVGTPGVWGVETRSGDHSQASSDRFYWNKVALEAGQIARESIASGTAAEIHVRTVEGTGEDCTG